MIFSRWLPTSGPALLPIPSVSGAGSEPFTRLKFWTLGHDLIRRLQRYEATGLPSTFRTSTWQTLRYWQLLLDEDDEGLARMMGVETELPDPAVWFASLR